MACLVKIIARRQMRTSRIVPGFIYTEMNKNPSVLGDGERGESQGTALPGRRKHGNRPPETTL